MGHYMSKGSCQYKTAEVNHTGFLPNNGEHFISDPFCQAGLGEYHTNYYRSEDKKYGRIHEIIKGDLCRSDKK